jgi:hypothetical protein
MSKIDVKLIRNVKVKAERVRYKLSFSMKFLSPKFKRIENDKTAIKLTKYKMMLMPKGRLSIKGIIPNCSKKIRIRINPIVLRIE